MAWIRAAKVDEIAPGRVRPVQTGSKILALTNIGGKYYAFQNPCTHMGGHLSEGMIMGSVVVCPLHGCQFDVTTGERLSGPADKPIRTYRVKVEGDDVLIDVEE